MGNFFSSISSTDDKYKIPISGICSICKKNVLDQPHFTFDKCNHTFCCEDLCKHLESFKTAKIACPFAGCSELIPDRIVRKCLTDATIKKYEEYSLSPDAVKCLVKDCNYFVGVKKKEGHFVCEDCQQPNCVKCSNLHGESELCGVSLKKNLYENNGSAILKEKYKNSLIKLSQDHDVIQNPEKSSCGICDTFLLPREGRLTSSCFHNFCKDCLKGHAETADIIARLNCPKCNKPLLNRECSELIGAEKLEFLNLKAVENRFYHCQTPDCEHFWDPGNFKGIHKCERCKKDNCIPCNDIHEGQTCKEFKESNHYKNLQKDEKKASELNVINCFNCNMKILRKGGCGALHCKNCDKQVCAFSGKELGPKGCMCRKSKRCDERCDIGCIPEGFSKYEEDLKKYFYNN